MSNNGTTIDNLLQLIDNLIYSGGDEVAEGRERRVSKANSDSVTQPESPTRSLWVKGLSLSLRLEWLARWSLWMWLWLWSWQTGMWLASQQPFWSCKGRLFVKWPSRQVQNLKEFQQTCLSCAMTTLSYLFATRYCDIQDITYKVSCSYAICILL